MQYGRSSFQPVGRAQQYLDGDRLWITEGAVDGVRLNDAHLAVLQDPVFAGVTDFNAVSDSRALIGGVDLTGEGLIHLKHLSLEMLYLRNSRVTDNGLEHLRGLPLKSLVLGGTLIEGEGLKHLAGMPLQYLDLADTRIGDEALPHLRDLPLRSVDLSRTRVTADGLASLKESMPGLVVVAQGI